ncbi:uncharacterized protein Dwil_GK26756 [Drosophila willistoni]|uniref:Uncharacterized protein n=1 Tax=Drosophila willistoni TaxID=7260 RepID=A0A0Q9WT31_DROWI|nr:uncharacterized protein Dwil_GK26756 [Drosophila willistoni]
MNFIHPRYFTQQLSNNSSSSSTFSSSSQQQSSVDYEAEDENEDKQKQRCHRNENEHLIHVQNFLKCFGPTAYATTAASTIPSQVPVAGTTTTTTSVTTLSTELRNWRQNYRSPSTCTAAISSTSVATTSAIPPIQSQNHTHSSNKDKLPKFQINAKFLRKPRNKLMKLLHTTTTTTTTTTSVARNSEQTEKQPLSEQLQTFNDDSNAKFKDFSIDSLLNK